MAGIAQWTHEAVDQVGDCSSAVRILECMIDMCTFEWPQSRETFFATPCQQFFQDFRVAWESVLSAAAYMPSAQRIGTAVIQVPLSQRCLLPDLMNRLVVWDPTVEFRLPDDWCAAASPSCNLSVPVCRSVIFNECREEHFTKVPAQKIIVDVHELWEKMKRTSVTSTQRCRRYTCKLGSGADCALPGRNHPDLSKEECVTVSNANLSIIVAEVHCPE